MPTAPLDLAIKAFLSYTSVEKNQSPRSTQTHFYNLRRFNAFLGNPEVCTISSLQLRQFLQDRKDEGLKGKTLAGDICTLRSFFTFLLGEGTGDTSPKAFL